MLTPPVYSPFFSCLYDEPEPVGRLGRGTHYSVFKCVEWLDVERKRLDDPQVHDFAVIWDEDHDQRIIAAIEAIYMAGLLSPVQFIGEKKGNLTVIVAAKFYFNGTTDIDEYYKAVYSAANIPPILQDHWHVEIGSFDRVPESDHQCIVQGIINDSEHRVLTYLRNIDSLWNLGTKDYYPGM